MFEKLNLKDQFPILYIRTDLLRGTNFNEDTLTTHLHLRANFRVFDWQEAVTQGHNLDLDLHVYSDLLDIKTSKLLNMEERVLKQKSTQDQFITCIIGQLVKKYFPKLLTIDREQHFDETKKDFIIENPVTGVALDHHVEDLLFYKIYTVKQGHHLIVFDGQVCTDSVMLLLEHNYRHLLDKGNGHVFDEISLFAIDKNHIINTAVALDSYFDRFVISKHPTLR